MEIRFVSSLTAEDENYCAPALLKAVAALLDRLPITYTVRIETTGAQVFQHAHNGASGRDDQDPGKSVAPRDSRTVRFPVRAQALSRF